MEAGPQVRVVQPDPQQVFAFAEGGGTQCLAIPPGDVEGWRLRADRTTQPTAFRINFSMRDDPRFEELLRIAASRRQCPGYVLAVLWFTAGYIVKTFPSGAMARDGRAISTDAVRRFWHLTEMDAAAFNAAVASLISAGWLTYGVIEELEVLNRCQPVSAGVSRGNDVYHPGRAVDDVDVIPSGNKKTVSTTTSTTPVGPVRAGAGKTGNAGGASSLPAERAGAPPAVRPPPPAVSELMANPRGAVLCVADWLGRLRHYVVRSGYPRTERDRRDLERAVLIAMQGRRLAELLGLLDSLCETIDGGGGFRVVLRREGFL